MGGLLGGFGSGGGTEPLIFMSKLMTAAPLHGTVGIQQPSVFGVPTSSNRVTGTAKTALPTLQPISTLNAIQPVQQSSSIELIDSTGHAPSQQIPRMIDTKSAMAMSGVDQSEKTPSKLPSTWNDMGSLNLDLVNFSLINYPTKKKAAMTMNSMKTSHSSSKSPSPLSPIHKGGVHATVHPT